MKISLARRYRFAASHRLHNPKWSAQVNRELYGKCNSPYGHGHNYVLEVAFTGSVAQATGMIASLSELDSFVEREVIEAFDHKYLNEEVEEFRDVVPTTENLVRDVFHRLRNFPGAKLERVRIEETSKNSFEFRGD
jgi:6-pyruvoyltetrahydropterin/6-carboxytetrahydropterin synthase